MSEFELISLFNEFFDDTFPRLTDFMTGTFAMLISTFFVGARLSKNMARRVALLYTLLELRLRGHRAAQIARLYQLNGADRA